MVFTKKLSNNRKGMVPIAIGLVIVTLVVLGMIYFSGIASGADVPSLTPNTPECKNPPTMGVRVNGNLFVEDVMTYFIGIDPEPKKISVSSVNVYRLGIFEEDYTWKVCLVDEATNNEVDCDSGKDALAGGKSAEQQFTLDFTLPDNNCDGLIDDFDARLVGSTIQDGKEVKIESKLQFRSGKWVQVN